MKSDFLIALTQLAAERHLPKEQVLQAIEVALASAFKKDNPVSGQNIAVKLNPNTGEVNIYAMKTVVDEVTDPSREIGLNDAQKIKKGVAVGDEVAAAEPLPHNASRIAAQTAKQVVLQRLREAERELLYQEFLQHQGDIISGVIEQIEPGRTIVLDLGRAQGILPPEEQVHTERYKRGQRIKVYVLNVRNTTKGPEILVSRSHKDMLKRLFEIEVPEVYNGIVEIKGIAREAGYRSKVAVYATQEGIDPVGSCIGIRGNRIQSIVNELQGEKIDVVPWEKESKAFISRAISPSEVIHVEISPTEQTAMVVVPDRQLSLAIGKEGQNARLAARLTGWRLDIKGLTEWEEIKAARGLEMERQRQLEEQRKKEERLAQEAQAELQRQQAAPVAEAEAPAAKEVVEPVAEEAGAPVAEAAEPEPVTAELPAEPQVAEEAPKAIEELEEDAILAGLLREEEEAKARAEEEGAGISLEELDSFTFEELGEEGEEEEEEYAEEEEDFFSDIPQPPVLTPDAGKIRFAEDIVGDYRGSSSRRDRKARRGGGGGGGQGKGARRGR